ncbi:ferrous iron transport protein A [Clostridium sardiniense]|uniref:FeoA family protein n=1 Tax=Clostridium sardiniense TaxID=29369 RepID=UPI00195689AE|nr:FeoA domain-containing protein [Clostridium sardiniense]MBM7833288.1 ferrous iron transport protein A [Clostridium sardiniense]
MVPMAFIDEGTSVTVKDIRINEKMGKRIQEMGVNTGAIIDIIKNDGISLIIGISGMRVAINRGMAQKILVEE